MHPGIHALLHAVPITVYQQLSHAGTKHCSYTLYGKYTFDCSTEPSCLNTVIGCSTLLNSCLAQATAPATGGALRLTGGELCIWNNACMHAHMLLDTLHAWRLYAAYSILNVHAFTA